MAMRTDVRGSTGPSWPKIAASIRAEDRPLAVGVELRVDAPLEEKQHAILILPQHALRDQTRRDAMVQPSQVAELLDPRRQPATALRARHFVEALIEDLVAGVGISTRHHHHLPAGPLGREVAGEQQFGENCAAGRLSVHHASGDGSAIVLQSEERDLLVERERERFARHDRS